MALSQSLGMEGLYFKNWSWENLAILGQSPAAILSHCLDAPAFRSGCQGPFLYFLASFRQRFAFNFRWRLTCFGHGQRDG